MGVHFPVNFTNEKLTFLQFRYEPYSVDVSSVCYASQDSVRSVVQCVGAASVYRDCREFSGLKKKTVERESSLNNW